jgi:hypothetical protein
MQAIITASGLREAIILLENKRKSEEAVLRKQLHETYESIKPINIIKATYADVVASQDLKYNLVNTAVGLTVGYVCKTLFEGVAHSPLRKLAGTVLLFGITNVIRKNPEAVKSFAKKVFNVVHNVLQERKTLA